MPLSPLVRIVAAALTMLGVLLIAYFGWFPFDFVDQDRSFSEVLDRFSWTTGPLWHPREVPSNIALFLPLGSGVAGVVRTRGVPRRRTLLAVAAFAVLWSTIIELVQAAWLSRDPAVDDIVANTIGALAGGMLLIRFEQPLSSGLVRGARALDRRRRRGWCLALSALPTLFVAAAVVAARDGTQLDSWDTSYPLVLGNEATGDRPWSGQIAAASLIDQALSESQVSALLDGQQPGDVAPGSEYLAYDFTVDQVLPDGLVAAGGHGRQDDMLTDDGLRVGGGRWVASSEPPTPLVANIATRTEFTTYLDVTTASLNQGGPARILTISASPSSRDLTVAQEGADLIVRIRSEFAGINGGSPEFAVPGAFEGGRHAFVIVYDGSSVRVSIDDTSRSSTIDLFPATVPMVERFTDDVGRLRFSRLGDLWRNGFLAASAFGPWAVCNAVLASAGFPRWWSLARVAVAVIAIGLLFWRALPQPALEPQDIVLAVAITAAVYAAAKRATSRVVMARTLG